MAKPNIKPRKQKSRPTSRSLWPSIPRKVTVDKSGSLSAASPPSRGDAKTAGEASAPQNMMNKKVSRRRPSAVAKFDVKFTIKRILSVAFKKGIKPV